MMRILIIEDEKTKIERLRSFLEDFDVVFKESFQGGMSELKRAHQDYDFLILDMTIPMWDKGSNDLGGNYEQFGGERVLREMKRKKFYLPTVLFTMFDVFPLKEGSITFDELNEVFLDKFKEFYKGAVYYDVIEDSWTTALSSILFSASK